MYDDDDDDDDTRYLNLSFNPLCRLRFVLMTEGTETSSTMLLVAFIIELEVQVSHLFFFHLLASADFYIIIQNLSNGAQW
jgi:hypothetical protein